MSGYNQRVAESDRGINGDIVSTVIMHATASRQDLAFKSRIDDFLPPDDTVGMLQNKFDAKSTKCMQFVRKHAHSKDIAS